MFIHRKGELASLAAESMPAKSVLGPLGRAAVDLGMHELGKRTNARPGTNRSALTHAHGHVSLSS